METVSRFESRRAEQLVETTAPPQTDAARMLAVTASYLLSEDGRKASLLSGGNGRALQELVIQVPANRLHLVAVDAQGRARLKLRPRFELNGDQRVVRIDSPPTYDTAPSIEDLFREAGRNHQLEHAFHAEHSAARHARTRSGPPTSRRSRGGVFEGAAATSAPPANAQPPALSPGHTSTAGWCSMSGAMRATLAWFRPKRTSGFAPTFVPEARRSNVRLRHRSRRMKRRNVRSPTGSPSLEHRSSRRATPPASCRCRRCSRRWPTRRSPPAIVSSVIRSMERLASSSVSAQLPQYAQVAVNPTDLKIFGTDAVTATEAQWTLVQRLQAAFPDATVTLRQHRIAWKGDSEAPTLDNVRRHRDS